MKKYKLETKINKAFEPLMKELEFTDMFNADPAGMEIIKNILGIINDFNDEIEELKEQVEFITNRNTKLELELEKIKVKKDFRN